LALLPLELPRCKTPDVDVVVVEPWVIALMGELHLEFHLVRVHRQVADRARGADSWPAPGAVRSAVREVPDVQYIAH
jgi:hypothetical protein